MPSLRTRLATRELEPLRVLPALLRKMRIKNANLITIVLMKKHKKSLVLPRPWKVNSPEKGTLAAEWIPDHNPIPIWVTTRKAKVAATFTFLE